MSTDTWMDEDVVFGGRVCACAIKRYSAIKKKWNLAICDNMNGPQGHYAKKISQIKTDKYQMISFVCGI